MQDEEYPIAWKSIEAGRLDYVNATAAGKTEFPGFISFKTPSMPMASQPADKEAEKQVNLVGGIAGQTDHLIAFALKEDEKGNEIEHELGLLNVVSYAKVRNKVVLVPVNGASVPANVKTEINAVFAQSVAEWDVVIDAGYTVDPSVLADLDTGESGMLASFPKNMRDFIQTFKKERDEDKNAYYLFIIPGNKSKRAGFMPFKRQFGFIYLNRTSNTARTIAHELAHGAFRLRHTFSPEAFIAGQGKTNNLMDYPAGPELRKYQWDNVHEPESMSGWFEDDAEVAMEASILAFSDFMEQEAGAEASKSNCWPEALERGISFYKKFKDSDIAFQAGMITLLLCETQNENCGAESDIGAFSCGFSNALLQELDWFVMVEMGSEVTEANAKKLLECIITSYQMGVDPDHAELSDVAFKCLTGGTIDDMKEAISKFVQENWREPYYQGQATAFILTLVSPYKAKIIANVKKIPKFTSKVTKLDKLAIAKSKDELVEIAASLAKEADEVIEKVGKYDWNLVRRYIQHVQEVTGRPIGQKQIDNLKDALRVKEYKKLSKADYTTHQKAYSSSRKEKMIKEWEENTGQKWPVDDKGKRYQLHHIIEQQYGGPHEWWNAHPARFPDQHQGGIHGVGSPARELFK